MWILVYSWQQIPFNICYILDIAPVVQWIERFRPKEEIQVRFLVGAQTYARRQRAYGMRILYTLEYAYE